MRTSPRCPAPDAIRPMRARLRTGNDEGRIRFPCALRASRFPPLASSSQLNLRADQNFSLIDFRDVPVQWPRRRAADHLTVNRKDRVVAGTEKLSVLLLPV